MKNLVSLIKKFLGEILVVLGTGIFVFNLFKFIYATYHGVSRFALFGNPTHFSLEINILFSAISASLIVVGILAIKNKNNKKI